LIERSILVQEAKHAIKDNKQLDKMMEIADRVWKEEQLPVLERQNQVDNEHVLKEKLAERGRSLDVLKSNFKQDFLAQGFLQDRLKDKLRIELPEELKYYNDHMHDRDFQRPAQITWRELVVETAKYPDKAAARRKIESLARALRQGADFAKLAKAESDGPAIVRDQGGLMQTSPGSYAVKSVNDALGSLAIGATSGVLEGPTSFHIVRVEGRRGAGPASFEEVRAQIRPKLAEEKFKKERSAFVKKLRDRTLVSTIFDPPPAALTATNK
jgi:peptidyl-prolyl cis-trans isomerase SurA